jgi:hypothetical protein
MTEPRRGWSILHRLGRPIVLVGLSRTSMAVPAGGLHARGFQAGGMHTRGLAVGHRAARGVAYPRECMPGAYTTGSRECVLVPLWRLVGMAAGLARNMGRTEHW